MGTWSRADGESNQVYTFKEDGRVELRDYTSPDGGTIDRNASYPQTLVLSFTGTYILVGDILRINFTAVQTNNPAGQTPSVRDKQVNIRISGNTLTMEERDANRIAATVILSYSDQRLNAKGDPEGEPTKLQLRNRYVFGREGGIWRVASFSKAP